ncbi:uncharacterized protein LOC106156636 [Lingula anatina]|uniref:Uncharacterized protein LOC106156636 n=1 Tax=Lingula anatina TaxID=7574 RepID=A0A1S3HPF7_LINAN|nr:uncharacterized protein LOC106156636 [Lingula anatina]|eukprot:XP_013387426.1 uncharacterized protein LOC106156636 [Lingula anatina]
MAGLLNDSEWRLENGDLIQQIAFLSHLQKNPSGNSKLYEAITAGRIGYELYQRVSGARELDAYRNQTIMAIADYVKKHPKASEKELVQEVQKQLAIFAQKVENL